MRELYLYQGLWNSLCTETQSRDQDLIVSDKISHSRLYIQSVLHPVFKGSALTAGAKFSKGKHFDVDPEIRDHDENVVITYHFGKPVNLFLLP